MVALPDWANLLVSLLWTLAIINALNLLDIVDGLAGGIALIASATLLLLSLLSGQPALAGLLAVVFQRKPHLQAFLVFWGLVAAGLGVGGVWLSFLVVATGRLPRLFRYRSRLPRAWSVGDALRIVGLMVMVAGLLPFVHISLIAWGWLSLDSAHLWSVVSTFLLHGLLLLVVWGFASAKALPVARALGLSIRRGARAIPQGLVGYVSVFPWIMGLLIAIVLVCQALGIRPPTEPIQELLLEERGWVVGLTVVLACVIGPVAEEVLFRGVLFGALRRRSSRLVAMVISGALFSAAHTNAVGFVPILLLGCVLADLYERTGSLLSPIAVHMVHNSLLVGTALTLKELVAGG